MNKQITLLSLVGISLLSAGSAYALDGTINFTGNIITESCTIDGGSANQTVILGDVADSAFTAAGDAAAPTAFTIDISACPVAVSEVTVKFDGIADADNNELLALDGGSTATGVAVEIADAQGERIPMFSESPLYTVVGGEASLQFVGRYVATSATVAAGSANATSQFTIVYQ